MLPTNDSKQDGLSSSVEAQTETGHELGHSPSKMEGVTKMQKTRGFLGLSCVTLGVIYGDLGTSPLYTMNGIFPAAGPAPSAEDAIGAVSCIIWALTIVVLIKYAVFALEFGTIEGEGGPFAVYTALFPPKETKRENRALTTYTTASVHQSFSDRVSFFHQKFVKNLLLVLALFGVGLTMADGLLTPAVSVTSAVGGIGVPFPSVANKVVGISCAFLILLWLLQTAGTRRIGSIFAPIMVMWFCLNLVTGAINVSHYPGIFRAFDPSRAVLLFVRTKNYDILSGVILCITGTEALFANLGQFSKNSIRFSFTCFVYPCLLLAYLGQGARLVADPENVVKNVFFQSIPGGSGTAYWWITWIFAILASIIASQAMITAAFSLIQQLTTLGSIPPLKIVHTDDNNSHRIFVPVVNFLILIGTIGLVCGFGTDVGLTNAYGFSVASVMIITTIMLSVAVVQLKHLNFLLAIAFFLFFGFFDCLFWGATLKKVPHGAWFTLTLGLVLLMLMLSWTAVKKLEDKFDEGHRVRLTEVMRLANDRNEDTKPLESGVALGDLSTLRISEPQQDIIEGGYKDRGIEASSGASLARLPIFAFFHNSSAIQHDGVPHSFSAFLRSYPSLPSVIVFLTVRTVGVPHVAHEDRYLVDRVRTFSGLYIATIRFGYRDIKSLENVVHPLRDRIVALEARSDPANLDKKVRIIDESIETAVTHILPNFYVVADPASTKPRIVRYIRKFFIEEIYRRIKVNFDEYEQYRFGDDQDVLRMSVVAPL
ncbi:uncharacterized protein JCM6883_004477 [Sporobolomyces salmoneus]|uniref:uncharacterized protein n=1 Tax=Sporobolomyces salmoneus TaxID=183962 RepID=UPI003180086A